MAEAVSWLLAVPKGFVPLPRCAWCQRMSPRVTSRWSFPWEGLLQYVLKCWGLALRASDVCVQQQDEAVWLPRDSPGRRLQSSVAQGRDRAHCHGQTAQYATPRQGHLASNS